MRTDLYLLAAAAALPVALPDKRRAAAAKCAKLQTLYLNGFLQQQFVMKMKPLATKAASKAHGYNRTNIPAQAIKQVQACTKSTITYEKQSSF